MARAIWHGAISFGLIYAPVDLYSAAQENTMRLHLLDSRDFAPVGYQRINKSTGKEVEWSHIVKGFEYKKGEYVALTDTDFKHANVKASETIDIEHFTAAADIPAQFYETPYYVLPGKGGQKVYNLLRKAMEEADKVAIATFVMRGRQHLCAVLPHGSALMLLTLRFSQELLPPVDAPKASAARSARISSAELVMAKQVIAGMSSSFKPAQYRDTYKADLMRRVREKVRNKQIHSLSVEKSAGPSRPKAEVIDLMTALKNSLKVKQKGKA
jgi:DNA end-binding protein Ku